MRLSDQCALDGCTEPHYRRFSHIEDGHTRMNFCCEQHQIQHLAALRRKRYATASAAKADGRERPYVLVPADT